MGRGGNLWGGSLWGRNSTLWGRGGTLWGGNLWEGVATYGAGIAPYGVATYRAEVAPYGAGRGQLAPYEEESGTLWGGWWHPMGQGPPQWLKAGLAPIGWVMSPPRLQRLNPGPLPHPHSPPQFLSLEPLPHPSLIEPLPPNQMPPNPSPDTKFRSFCSFLDFFSLKLFTPLTKITPRGLFNCAEGAGLRRGGVA